MLKKLIRKLITLAVFIASSGAFYIATSFSFATSFINIALFIVAVFLLLQGCDRLDKAFGYGKYSGTTEEEKDKTE